MGGGKGGGGRKIRGNSGDNLGESAFFVGGYFGSWLTYECWIINYYLRGGAGLLQKSRLATMSLPFSSSYAYSICFRWSQNLSYTLMLRKERGGREKGSSSGSGGK